ncbi:hypothetical protein MJH12_06020 [bacterium]|nr:hypothetical protein [bacterium]
MLTNDRISLMMDTLYGEEEENTSFHEEELKEITFLEEQMSFLDHWDI